jgi:hypothetical protein
MRTPRIAAAACLALLATAARADDAPPGERALEAVRRHGVMVAFRFQKDLVAEEEDAVPPDPQGPAERWRFWRLSYVAPGFVVRDRRTVVISDTFLSPTAVQSVTVLGPDGSETPARMRGFLASVPGMVLEAEADLPVEPVVFPEASAGAAARLWVGSLAEGADGIEAWAAGIGGERRQPWAGGEPGYGLPESVPEGLAGGEAGLFRTVDLVLDERGTPLGLRFGADLPPGGGWRGASVLAATEVPLASLRERAAALTAGPSIHRVKVAYRTTSRHDREGGFSFFGSRDTTEEEFWGVAVTADTLVVPGQIDDEAVRKIIDVKIADDDGPGLSAAFVGRLAGYEAFLVRRAEGAFVPVPDEGAPVPPIGAAMLVHQVAWRGGRRKDQVDYVRVAGFGRAYGDRRFLATENEVGAGAFLRDLEGRWIGFAAVLDPADQERSLAPERPSRERSPYPAVAVLFRETGGPAALATAPDTRVMPQEEAESRRSPWLGVEYDEIDEGVAELLGVSGPTRDGRRGLVVIRVYDGSPAARAGIQEDDVLLAVRRTSAPGSPPIDLRPGRPQNPFSMRFPWEESAPAPWRDRSNALVELLKTWGTGATYQLTWLHGGEERTSDLTVEPGPPDFASAPRVFDEASGLEVRDLTYEVKRALRLPDDAHGVVVGRVEEGSPAAQARILANELLREMNGAPIADAADFESLLDAARTAELSLVRLVVQRLGKTRLVDLRLATGGGDAAGDEGE